MSKRAERRMIDGRLYERVYGAEATRSRAKFDLVQMSPTCGNAYWRLVGQEEGNP